MNVLSVPQVAIGDSAWADAEVPRSNFDTFLNAFVTIFQVPGKTRTDSALTKSSAKKKNTHRL
jgi:hypothetical protein